MAKNEIPEHLMQQADQYCRTMIEIKKLSVNAMKGPTDVPSLIAVRYGTNIGSPAYNLARENTEGNVVIHEEGGVALCERLINITEFAGPNAQPGPHVLTALMQFADEYKESAPWTLGMIADGISVLYPEDPAWRSFQESHGDKSLHDMFCDFAEAQQWLSECITVFIMDMMGHMVSNTVRYSYGDDTFPPKPIFSPTVARYEGTVFERDRKWVTDQRVIVQFAMFFSKMEGIDHLDFSGVDLRSAEGDDSHTQENPL